MANNNNNPHDPTPSPTTTPTTMMAMILMHLKNQCFHLRRLQLDRGVIHFSSCKNEMMASQGRKKLFSYTFSERGLIISTHTSLSLKRTSGGVRCVVCCPQLQWVYLLDMYSVLVLSQMFSCSPSPPEKEANNNNDSCIQCELNHV
jgi:hypothetical protein